MSRIDECAFANPKCASDIGVAQSIFMTLLPLVRCESLRIHLNAKTPESPCWHTYTPLRNIRTLGSLLHLLLNSFESLCQNASGIILM